MLKAMVGNDRGERTISKGKGCCVALNEELMTPQLCLAVKADHSGASRLLVETTMGAPKVEKKGSWLKMSQYFFH
jgi:hypothetical protein